MNEQFKRDRVPFYDEDCKPPWPANSIEISKENTISEVYITAQDFVITMTPYHDIITYQTPYDVAETIEQLQAVLDLLLDD